jgi:hypothetical protein
MSIFSKLEDIYYSIYRIELIYGQNPNKPPKLILYFREKFGCIELEMDEIGNSIKFCERYSELYQTPAPSFNSRTWDAFKKMILERAQVLET